MVVVEDRAQLESSEARAVDREISPAPKGNKATTTNGVRRARHLGLEWVMLAGALRPVSAFAHLPPKKRPLVTCPECARPVTLKLGTINAHHAAHAPEDLCAATNPESALHINTKCYIAAQLQAALSGQVPVRVRQRCVVGDPRLRGRVRDNLLTEPEQQATLCTETDERVWLEAWDQVMLEHRVSQEATVRIPDIALEQHGRIVGAIEIFVTHAVSAEKEAALAALGIPWLEVRASDFSCGGHDAWRLSMPLPLHREGSASFWRCPNHQRAFDQYQAQIARRELEERERVRHTTRVRAARVVDVLYPSGKWFRRIYAVSEYSTDAIAHTLTLTHEDESVASVALRPNEQSDACDLTKARVVIQQAYRQDLSDLEMRTGAVIDSPMRWAKGRLAARLLEAAGRDRPSNQPRPLASRYPRRWFFKEKEKLWRMPRYMEGVHWDRAEDDAFAEHAVWTTRAAETHVRNEPRAAAQQPLRRETPRQRAATTGGSARSVRSTTRLADATNARDDAGNYPGTETSIYRTSPVPLAARLSIGEFGSAVAHVVAMATVDVGELRTNPGSPRRVLITAKAPITAAVISAVEIQLEDGVERVWLSPRYDWSHAFAEIPWLPLARDRANRGVVILENQPIPANEFARRVAQDDDNLFLERIYRSGAVTASTLAR